MDPSAPDSTRFDLAIIGGGAGGTLVALQALRRARPGARVVLVEPGVQLASGVAYATTHPEHLLNVPAGRMSAFEDAPADFVDYLAACAATDSASPTGLAGQYAQRRHYGAYLRRRLGEAEAASAGSLAVCRGRVASLRRNEHAITLQLESGPPLQARAVVLAVGNSPRPLPARGAALLTPGLVLEAWDFDAVKRMPTEAAVCIAGTGLSMVDTALSLACNGHRGRIHVLSRHALLPLPHVAHVACDYDPRHLMDLGLRQRMASLRGGARAFASSGAPWQAVMERVRPRVQDLWQTLSHDDQRRFLRHVLRYWDVHRHRIAPQVYARLQELQDSGQMQMHRGRMDAVAAQGGRIRVGMRMRDGRLQELDVDRVVNATGVEMRAPLMRNPLLSDLLANGLARPGPHGIGVDTGAHGELLDAEGAAVQDVIVVGSLRIGSLWESIAVPELRGQAEAAARRLLGAGRS